MALSTAHSTAFHIKDKPYLPCPTAMQFYNPSYRQAEGTRTTWAKSYLYSNIYAIQTQHCMFMHSTASVYSRQTKFAMTVATTFSSHPQYNSLSMHINMHYTPSTTDSTALQNPPVHSQQDVGKVWKYCGVIHNLFGWFLRFPFLHPLVSFRNLFVIDLYATLFTVKTITYVY